MHINFSNELQNIQVCYITLFGMYSSRLPSQNLPLKWDSFSSVVADNVSLLFMRRVCPVVDNVSLLDFDYFTAAQAMIFFICITIRTSAIQANRVYHELLCYISLITAVKIPVKVVISTGALKTP